MELTGPGVVALGEHCSALEHLDLASLLWLADADAFGRVDFGHRLTSCRS